MKAFKNGEIIRIVRDERAELIGRIGRVARLRISDNAAWVAMDQPLPDNLRRFPADDPRGDHILLAPEDCEPASEKQKP